MRKDTAFKGARNPGLGIAKQDLNLQGLHTYPNSYSAIPPGSLVVANNCVIDAPGVVESRRGLKQYGTYVVPPRETLTITEYDDDLITQTSDSKINYDDGTGLFTAVPGTYQVPDPVDVESRVRFSGLNKNLYFTTSRGIYKMDAPTTTPRLAGAPQGLGGSGVVTGTGWMPNTCNVAYRILWLYIDANGNLIRGAPSDRIIVSNNVGAGKNVSLTFTIPYDISVDPQIWTYQVYRSNTSATLATTPDDSMQQVFQGVPTAPQLASRVITIIDSDPDTVKGQLLYTSAEGIQNANQRPPFSTDVALFKGYTFYSDCSFPELFFLSLISGSNMVNGDTITFTRADLSTSFTLTAGASENILTGTFFNQTGGSPAVNIATTAQSMINVMNLYASNTFLEAYYVSGFNDTPGQMLFQDRSLNTPSFFVNCSNTGLLFNPTLPASGSVIDNTSTDDNRPNNIYYSKLQSPEAVPRPNSYSVGSSSSAIVRILSLQDTLVIIKTDGIYKLTGTSPSNFTVSPIDTQMRVAAANTAVILNNMVYVWVDQGVIRITDSGSVELISLPIQEDLLKLNSSNYPGFKGATYGVSYPPDHKYIICTIRDLQDETSTQAFVYNYITDAWTTWDIQYASGYMRPSNELLYFGTEGDLESIIVQERKKFDLSDYADYEFQVDIESVAPNPINPLVTDIKLTLGTFNNVAVNQTIRQVVGSNTFQSVIVAIDGTTRIINVLNNNFAWQAGPATLYNPIEAKITMAPCYGDTPNATKKFTELSLITDAATYSTLYADFFTDISKTNNVPFALRNNRQIPGWGLGEWGLFPWGSTANGGIRVRTYIPREASLGDWIATSISVRNAFNRMRISGVSLLFRPISARIR